MSRSSHNPLVIWFPNPHRHRGPLLYPEHGSDICIQMRIKSAWTKLSNFGNPRCRVEKEIENCSSLVFKPAARLYRHDKYSRVSIRSLLCFNVILDILQFWSRFGIGRFWSHTELLLAGSLASHQQGLACSPSDRSVMRYTSCPAYSNRRLLPDLHTSPSSHLALSAPKKRLMYHQGMMPKLGLQA